jgi:hypothetical protein
MLAKRMENWDAADFGRYFRNSANAASSGTCRDKLNSLADVLSPMGGEFCRETASCGRNLAAMIEEISSIAGRSGYCAKPRGYDHECEALFQDVDQAVSRVESLRETCFV